MASSLTSKERAHLKARAHALEPFVQTGGAGITDAVVKEVDRALTAHELLKVRIGTADVRSGWRWATSCARAPAPPQSTESEKS